ncbi:MAG: hypothetical protein IKN14_05245 [Clostridiales bacterium]|nr:hypothetical protein [Clostridiales bacterium]
MKKIRTAVALLLVGSMVAGLTACSGGKLSPSKLAKAAKAVGAEEYEPEDFQDEIEDISGIKDFGDYSEGIYTSGKIDDVKKVLKADSIDIPTKKVTEATVFFSADYDKKKNADTMCIIASLVFEDKDSARKFYEDSTEDLEEALESFEDMFDNVSQDDGEDGYEYYIVSFGNKKQPANNYGIYLDGKTVIVIEENSDGSKDLSGMADSICDELGIKAPSEA